VNVPPCTENPVLFDTDEGPDAPAVQVAKRICRTCPTMFVCRDLGREGDEYGVWGGESRPERVRHLIGPGHPEGCGTEVAFKRHLALEEECEECRDAHRARARVYDEARRKRKREEQKSKATNGLTHAPVRPECNTARGYKTHQKRGELRLIAQCKCREAYAEDRKQQRQAAREKAKAAA
jgi:hypothetical protein